VTKSVVSDTLYQVPPDVLNPLQQQQQQEPIDKEIKTSSTEYSEFLEAKEVAISIATPIA